MAAACSAALHIVGQKCCDDSTAQRRRSSLSEEFSGLSPSELQRKKRTSDVELQKFRRGSSTFKVRSFEMRNFGFSPDKNLHHSTWSHEQSRAEVEW